MKIALRIGQLREPAGRVQRTRQRHNAGGSASVSKSITDAFGNRNSITKRNNADGSESISITKTNRRNTF